MANVIESVKPQFGINYKVGYVGFTYIDNNFLSNGIAWVTSWEKGDNPDVPKLDISHTFIVTGENECVEAIKSGVVKSPLTKYFDNPHAHVSFRKPIGMTDETGKLIALEVEKQIGKLYDWSLIIGHFLDNNIIGKILDGITNDASRKFITRLFNTKRKYICSESVSTALNSRPEYRNKGILSNPPYSIDPQGLFQEKEIFSRWVEKIQGVQI